MRIFTRKEPSGDYTVTIKTPIAYNLEIKPISIRMNQTSLAIQAAKDVANVSKLAGMC